MWHYPLFAWDSSKVAWQLLMLRDPWPLLPLLTNCRYEQPAALFYRSNWKLLTNSLCPLTMDHPMDVTMTTRDCCRFVWAVEVVWAYCTPTNDVYARDDVVPS